MLEEAINSQTEPLGQTLVTAKLRLRGCYVDRGFYLEELGRQLEAAEAYRRAILTESATLREAPRAYFFNSPNRKYDAWFEMLRLGGFDDDVEEVLREQLSVWQELESDPRFDDKKWTYKVRRLEVQLRLAEWLASKGRYEDAAEAFAAAAEIIDSPIEGDSNMVEVCVHVCPEKPMANATVESARRKIVELYAGGVEPTLIGKRKAIRSNPFESVHPLWDPWCDLALAFYRPRQWKGAETEAREAIVAAGDHVEWLTKMAPFLLLAGETEEYQELCQRLLSLSDERQGNALKQTLQICLLAPENDDPEALLQAARRAAKESGNHHLLHVASYRAGQMTQAIDGLTADLQSPAMDLPIVQLHLAIVHQLAGDPDEAKAWLEKAKAGREHLWMSTSKLHFEVLCQEAEMRIDRTSR
jgi:tetratricopeptide (TPR) repeat protein